MSGSRACMYGKMEKNGTRSSAKKNKSSSPGCWKPLELEKTDGLERKLGKVKRRAACSEKAAGGRSPFFTWDLGVFSGYESLPSPRWLFRKTTRRFFHAEVNKIYTRNY